MSPMAAFRFAMRLLRARNSIRAVIVILLVFFVWKVGPYLPYPFSSYVFRAIFLLVVLFLWGLITGLKRRKKGKKTEELMAEVSAPAEADVLKDRFKSAVKTLRDSEKAGRKGLMDLPWYVIIGPPGTGKTTVLRNAGLNFPLEETAGSAAVKGVGGTRDCDWWFTDEAVLLDTAGRYTTQDSNEETDRAAWTAFLDLLKGRRRRRPINGIFVAISADMLLSADQSTVESHAAAVRKRVLELYTRLKGRFPVYLLVTKIDLVVGFTEFFENLTADERQQVWGYTRKINPANDEEASIEASFDGEFEALLSRLASLSVNRLRDEPDERRRALILGFPEQMARARHRMRSFLTNSFAHNAYQDNIMVRGVYMTSGTQEGAPIDRLMGGLARALKVDKVTAAHIPATGRAYFIRDVLRKVAFPEQDLLGIGLREAKKRQTVQLAAYGGIVAAALLGMAAWSFVYSQERAYAKDAEMILRDYKNSAYPLPDVDQSFEEQSRQVVRRLNHLEQAKLDVKKEEPETPHFGLPYDDALPGAANDAYLGQLHRTLAPLIQKSLENRLQRRDGLTQTVWAFDEFEIDLLPLFVRAYASMENPRSRLKSKEAREIFGNTVLFDIEERDPELRQALGRHITAWVDQPRGPSPREIDRKILDGARASLSMGSDGLGPVRAAYSEWRFNQIYAATEGTNVASGLVDQIGLNANDVLRRRSTRDLNEAIPAVFTRLGFEKFYADNQDEIYDTMERDAWVYVAEGSDNKIRKSAAKDEISDLYVRDYIKFWRFVTSDVTVKQTDRANVLRIISRNDSPLKKYVAIVSDNTDLIPKSDKKGRKRMKGFAFKGSSSSDNTAPKTPRERVSAAFAEIAKLTGNYSNEDETPPIDTLVKAIGILSNEIAALEAGDSPTGNTAQAKIDIEATARDLKQSGGLDRVMRDVLGTASQGRAVGTATQLQEKYKQEVLRTCRRKISGRYPFKRGETRVVGLRDLEDVFGNNGVLIQFIENDLSPFIDRSQGGWSWRPEVRTPETNNAGLRQFEKAMRIRDAFFGSGGIGTQFDVTPIDMAGGAERVKVDIGGKQFEFSGNMAEMHRGARWPGTPASITFITSGRNDAKISPQNDWSLFYLLDRDQTSRLNVDRGGTGAVYKVTANDGRSFTFRIDMDSIDNPLTTFNRWRNFSCPSSVW